MIILKNGLRVENFSSPHQFIFDDGSIIEGTTAEVSKLCMATAVETKDRNERGFTNVTLTFVMNEQLNNQLQSFHNKWINKEVDIVLISLPTMTAMKSDDWDILNSPFRVVRLADRVNKTVSSNEFCI